jgi:hypothetical protein
MSRNVVFIKCRLAKTIVSVQYTNNYGVQIVCMFCFKPSVKVPSLMNSSPSSGGLAFQPTCETSLKERKQWSSSSCIHSKEWSSCISGAEETVNLLVLVSQFEIRALREGREGSMSYPAWHVIMTLRSVHCPF